MNPTIAKLKLAHLRLSALARCAHLVLPWRARALRKSQRFDAVPDTVKRILLRDIEDEIAKRVPPSA